MLDRVRTVLIETLHPGPAAAKWTYDTALLGNVPELDSMAVIGVITALEERFAIHIADDDVSGDIFATLGSLAAFVAEKVREQATG